MLVSNDLFLTRFFARDHSIVSVFNQILSSNFKRAGIIGYFITHPNSIRTFSYRKEYQVYLVDSYIFVCIEISSSAW